MAGTPNTPPGCAGKKMPAKKLSPGKKKNFTPPSKKKSGMRLVVRAFAPPLFAECYIFEKNDRKDGYTYGFRKYTKGEFAPETHAGVDDLGWIHIFPRRIPGSSDEIMKDGDDYMRQVIIRYAPDQESTEESRQQGLAALADFFGDERFSKFPAHNIQKMDVTDEDDYEPLDRFLMDDQIKDVIVTCCDSDDLKSDFASVYEDFANKIYAGQNVGKWARETLGFGNWFELCFYVCWKIDFRVPEIVSKC